VTDRLILIVGAGPTGLTLALELARFGVASAVVDAAAGPTEEGSRAIVIARHALDVWDDLGCARPMVEKGVVLARARTYFRDRELFCREFPEPAPGEIPLFINLQQVFTERVLRAAVEASRAVELRWGARVAALEQDAERATVRLEDGEELSAAYLVGCDGAHSTVRELLSVPFPGKAHHDRFLICDVRARLPFPNERRFFFDPPYNRGRTVLIHPQPDDEWRIDWQVPEQTDGDAERHSGRLHERVKRILGDTDYEVAWLTAYRFHQRVAGRWRVGRVFLAGDAAHRFSPFGARGMNSGIEDVANLGWKLALVARGEAGDALLDTYEQERRPAALANLKITAATMRFMAPPTLAHRVVRDGILRGSTRSAFLRSKVDSGRLADPAVYDLGRPEALVGRLAPRSALVDRDSLGDVGFAVASIGGEAFLVRPDRYVCAHIDGAVEPALQRALCRA
jgi:3-(3-hydroxy-phenyl)propionate hydroxylase